MNISEMEKYIKPSKGRESLELISITESGWVNISAAWVRKLNLNLYRSVEFLSSKKDHSLGIIFHKEIISKEVSLRKSKNTSSGFYIRKFILQNKEFLGRYKLKYSEEDKNSLITIFTPLN